MFAPYHRLGNCRRLRRVINELMSKNSIAPEVLEGHNRYHYALYYKLKCARHYVDRFEALLSTSAPEHALADSAGFIEDANRHLDGFFYSGGSALDIIAREVLTYFSIPLKGDVYFHTARTSLSKNRIGDPLLSRLQDPAWKEAFSNYRNALTHEVLLAPDYTITVRHEGGEQHHKIVFPLPDDPRDPPASRTYDQFPDATKYCKDHMRRLLSLINQIYGDIVDRTEAHGRLPL